MATLSGSRRSGREDLARRRDLGSPVCLHTLLVALVLSCPPTALAQSGTDVQVAIGTHALTLPWHPGPGGNGFDPVVMAGIDRAFRSGGPWKLSLVANLGFARDRWWMTSLSLEPEIRLGRALPGGLEADLGLGLGYMHHFWRRETWRPEGGRYVRPSHRGRPSLIIPLSWTLSYRGGADRRLAVSPFVSARWGVQALFLEEVPALSHLSLLVGVRIHRDDRGGGR